MTNTLPQATNYITHLDYVRGDSALTLECQMNNLQAIKEVILGVTSNDVTFQGENGNFTILGRNGQPCGWIAGVTVPQTYNVAQAAKRAA